MKCPVCGKVDLELNVLESGLASYRCEQCEGIWVSSLEYHKWIRDQDPVSVEERAGDDEPIAVSDTDQAKICPDCGHILSRYRFSADIEFHLDRCGHCQGVWFDRNEWHVLVSRCLHTKVNLFFTKPWQRRLREDEARRRFDEIYLNRFGAEDYARLKQIREWIYQHPQQRLLLAYLIDMEPYKV